MPGIEICRAFFFIHTKKNYFRSSVSEEEIHMKNSYFVYFLLIILSACNDKKSGTASLNGEIKGLGNDTIYIYGVDEMYDRMDTLLVENDKFSKTVSLDTLIAARLLFSDGTQYPFFMDEGNKIQIKGSAAELNSLEISGNTPNEEFSAFQKELKGLGTPSEKVLEDKAGKFINEHHSSLVSIYLLDKYFVQKEKPDYAQIKKLTEHMTGELKDRPYIDELLNHIQEEEKAAIGKTAPYFRKNKKFALLGVSLDMNKDTWQKAIKADTLEWEQVCDFSGWNAEIVKQLAIKTLPANILLNPFGKIEGKDMTEEAIKKKLKEIENTEKEKQQNKSKK